MYIVIYNNTRFYLKIILYVFYSIYFYDIIVLYCIIQR